MSKVEISKINIKIGGKEIALSLDEAKELRQILNDTFGIKEIVHYPPQPIVIERPIYPRPWQYWEVWCSGNSSSITYSLTSDTEVVQES